MFTDEDRKFALEVLAAIGGRMTKMPRELRCPSRQIIYRWIEDDRLAARRANKWLFGYCSNDTRKSHGPSIKRYTLVRQPRA